MYGTLNQYDGRAGWFGQHKNLGAVCGGGLRLVCQPQIGQGPPIPTQTPRVPFGNPPPPPERSREQSGGERVINMADNTSRPTLSDPVSG